jgi:MoxR-like ATPase
MAKEAKADSGVDAKTFERLKQARQQIQAELRKIVVGQEEPVAQLLTAMFAGGHCLIQGPLATGKTVLVDAIARVMDLSFKRIQFTPDLMPSDISGAEVLEEDQSGHRVVRFVKGPVFCHILMADEINRTPPKTQAALLEVMQEKQVTLGGQTHALPAPYYVLATQISMEQEGTYPLPEAQQDRFMLSIMMDYLPEKDEVAIVRQSTGIERPTVSKIIAGADLLTFQRAVRSVHLPPIVGKYIVELVDNTRPTVKGAADFVKEYVIWGAGLRASQNIALAAKSVAAQDGRQSVTVADVKKVLMPVLRHRVGLSFRAEVDKLSVEDLVRRLIELVPAPQAA